MEQKSEYILGGVCGFLMLYEAYRDLCIYSSCLLYIRIIIFRFSAVPFIFLHIHDEFELKFFGLFCGRSI